MSALASTGKIDTDHWRSMASKRLGKPIDAVTDEEVAAVAREIRLTPMSGHPSTLDKKV